MTENNNLKLNIQHILDEVNEVITRGVHKLLADYMSEYNEYAETHNAVMNIPAVRRLRNASVDGQPGGNIQLNIVEPESKDEDVTPNIHTLLYNDIIAHISSATKTIVYNDKKLGKEVEEEEEAVDEEEEEAVDEEEADEEEEVEEEESY